MVYAQLMIKLDLWKAKKRKATHREWRERKYCFGEMVQMDGSDHDWFEGRRRVLGRGWSACRQAGVTGRRVSAFDEIGGGGGVAKGRVTCLPRPER
jgi:hypothetical protein